MKKLFNKDLLVFWLSFAAMVCAVISLNDTLNKLENKKQK